MTTRRAAPDVLVQAGRAVSRAEADAARRWPPTTFEEPSGDLQAPPLPHFYSNESGKPAHVRVRRERKLAKFWLDPVELADSKRFTAHELREIERIVQDRRSHFLEAWNEHFGS